MREIEIQDKYNPDKVWLVKKYGCGHYHLNQKIKDNIFYKGYIRVTQKHLCDILDMEFYRLSSLLGK
jgi:hypothetical protein